jgi:ubiquinone/menaquinone biosynthesis C-methylase UbiE
MPLLAGLLGSDREAYRYLAKSVRTFKTPEEVSTQLAAEGFADVRLEKALGGAVCFHSATKK